MKLLIVDDHPIVLDGLAALLRHSEPAWEVLCAASAEAGLELLAANPDVALILLDLAMPGLRGLGAIDAIRAANPGLMLVVISASETAEDVRAAFAHGARGFIPKSSRPATLLAAIRLVLSGATYVPQLILGPNGMNPGVEPGAALSPRQWEVLEALSGGMSNKDIAIAFGLSEKTVKVHVTAIFRTLGVVNRTQAAALHRARPR